MVGIKKSKLILGIFIPILAFFLMSQNTFAAAVGGSNFLKYALSVNGSPFTETIRSQNYWPFPNTLLYTGSNVTSEQLNYFVMSAYLPSAQTGIYFNSAANFEIVADQPGTFTNANCINLTAYAYPEQGTIINSTNRAECVVSNNGRILNVTGVSNGQLQSETTASTWYSTVRNDSNYVFSCSNLSGSMVPPCISQEIKIQNVNINFQMTRDPTTANQETIINQNNTIINQNQQMIDHDKKEEQASDNIENQTAPSGTDNQQSTNLIGVLSGFISAFSNINATNCNLTLEFPDYAGGSRVVNICSGKDKAPRIVEIGSSLLLIGIFVPLAYILIKMIYHEIRSWTNG